MQGIVEVIKPNKGGFYATMLKDKKWYGGQKVPPSFPDGMLGAKGDEITFEVVNANGFSNIKEGSITRVTNDAPTAAVARTATTGGYTGDKWDDKDLYWERKEVRDKETQSIIQFQSARNTATSVLTVLLEQKVLPAFGGKKATHADQFADMLMDLTLRMNQEALEQGRVEGIAPIVSIPVADSDNE